MSIVKSFSFPKGDIRGDMFYIQHNSNNFTIIDCYLKEGDDESCRMDEIIKEVKDVSEARVCRFISTHPDKDHIIGLDELDKRLGIENFYAVDNDVPEDTDNASLSTYIKLKKDKNYAIKRGIRRVWLNEANDEGDGSGLHFLWPDIKNEKFNAELKKVARGESPNNISCVLAYCAGDGARYMWMGDLETDMQKEFYDCCHNEIPHIDILFHPHHGRNSGKLPKELMDALNPKLIVIGNAPSSYLNYEMSEKTITQNTAGDIVFVNEGNMVHVYSENEVKSPPKCLKKDPIELKRSKTCKWCYCGTLYIYN